MEDRIARPMLIGRPQVIESRITALRADARHGSARDRQPGGRSALSRLCDAVPLAGRPVRRDAGDGADHRAHQHHDDCGAGGQARRRRRDAVRPAGPLHQACARYPLGDRHAGRRQGRLGADHADHAARRVLPDRHLRQHRSDGRRARRASRCRRATISALQHRGEGGAAELFELRLARRRNGVQDARGLSQADRPSRRS